MNSEMKTEKLLTKVIFAVVLLTMAILPESAFAQANPILQGMQASGPLAIGRMIIVGACVMLFFASTLKDLLAGDGLGALKSIGVILCLAGIAVKLKEIIAFFDNI